MLRPKIVVYVIREAKHISLYLMCPVIKAFNITSKLPIDTLRKLIINLTNIFNTCKVNLEVFNS